MKAFGVAWAVAGLAFIGAGAGWLAGWSGWHTLLVGAAVGSAVLTALDLPYAAAGLVVDLVVLAIVVMGPRPRS